MLTFQGHGTRQPVTSVAFSPDGRFLSSGSDRSTRWQLWDLSGPEHQNWTSSVRAVTSIAFHPANGVVVSASASLLTQWDLSTKKTVSHRIPLARHSHTGVSFSIDGNFLGLMNHWFHLCRWGESGCEWDSARRIKSVDMIRPPTFSPDGGRVACRHTRYSRGRYAYEVTVWSVPDLTLRATLTGATNAFEDVHFHPSREQLVAGAGSSLIVWDIATGERIVHEQFGGRDVTGTRFTPDGRSLLIARSDGSDSHSCMR